MDKVLLSPTLFDQKIGKIVRTQNTKCPVSIFRYKASKVVLTSFIAISVNSKVVHDLIATSLLLEFYSESSPSRINLEKYL